MSLEIEVKSKVESLEEIETRIIEMGGVFWKKVLEEDIYFNHPSRDFSTTDEALRMRRVEGRYYLTYKGPKIDKLTKTREELNVEVDDWDGAIRILGALGFVEVLPIKKMRRYFTLRDFEVMLDEVEGLGSFVEVEKKGDYNPKELIDFLEGLGVKGSETRSYLELKLVKGKE